MDGDPALLARYECKYLVPDSAVPELRRCIRPFLQPDRFAAESAGTYPLCSLYLDSPDLRLLDMGNQGWSERFKLRVRSYSDLPEEPVYLEIKRRSDGIVHKRRLRIERQAALAFLRARAGDGLGSPGNAAALSEFGSLALAYRARPVLRIRYLREAHESRAGDPLRITFDTRIEQAWSRAGDIALDGGAWRAVPLGGTVLEIKFTNLYPAWVRALIRRFELERRSLSKYSLAMESARDERPGSARPGAGPARLRTS